MDWTLARRRLANYWKHLKIRWTHGRAARRPVLKWGLIGGIPLVLVALVLVFFKWNMLRGPLEDYLAERTHRPVHIDGDLRVAIGFSPTVTVNGLRIGNPEWVKADPDMAVVDRVRVQFKLLPLFIGRLILPSVDIERPQIGLIRQASGRANWEFEREVPNQPTRLPVMNSLRIIDGRLEMLDEQRKLTFIGTVNSHEGIARQGRAFFLEGKGRLNRTPFLMTVRGDSLLHVDPDTPWGFDADIRGGATRIVAQGSILEPFDFGKIETRLALNGNDLADLYLLTGLVMPNTPPYRLAGGLRRNGNHYLFRNFSGRVGDSDLGGTVDIDVSGERPYLKGDLRSRRLDFDDLGTLLGAPPATDSGETASPEQKREAAELAAQQRLLPDAPLNVDRVRAMNADVHYTAETVNARGLPLTKVVIGVDLHDGVLDLHPVSFNMTRGALSGRARIDARRKVPDVTIDMALNNARLEQFFGKGGDAALSGTVEARARLHGAGRSVRDAVATSNGNLALAIPNGEMRKAFAELLGINVASGLGLLLSGDESKTELRCSVADFHARNGVLTLDTMVFDTGPVLATGSGTVDMRSETMNLRLEGHPKKPELIRLMAPITLTGRLRNPQVGIEPGKAIAQAGIAGALASFLSPLAGILPFLSPGLAKDANCAQLIAQARSDGVPVALRATPLPAQR